MKIRWRNFLTGEDDPTVGRVSFLSEPEEWHAAGVGYVATVAVAVSLAAGVPLTAVLSGSAGVGFVSYRVVRKHVEASGHVADAAKETAYAAFGSLVGMVPAAGILVFG